jgi:hypothetical protein
VLYEPVCVLTMKEPVERRALMTRPHGVALLRSVYVRKLRKMLLRDTDVLAHGSQYDAERLSTRRCSDALMVRWKDVPRSRRA